MRCTTAPGVAARLRPTVNGRAVDLAAAGSCRSRDPRRSREAADHARALRVGQVCEAPPGSCLRSCRRREVASNVTTGDCEPARPMRPRDPGRASRLRRLASSRGAPRQAWSMRRNSALSVHADRQKRRSRRRSVERSRWPVAIATDSPSSFACWRAHDPWFRREASDQRRRSREDVLSDGRRRADRCKRVLRRVLGECGWRAANAAGLTRSVRRRGGRFGGGGEVVRGVVMAISTYRGAARPSGARAIRDERGPRFTVDFDRVQQRQQERPVTAILDCLQDNAIAHACTCAYRCDETRLVETRN